MGTAQQDWTVGKMSEHEGTPRNKRRASRDEEVPEGVDAETGEITEQTIAEAAEADGSTDIEERLEITLRENRERLEAVVGVSLEGRECEKCGATGFIPPGSPGERRLKHPPELVACERCDGEGEVETGSKNPLHEATVCTACNGTGWKVQTMQPENVTPIVREELTYQGSPQAPVMGWQQPDGTFVPLGTPQAGNG